MKATNIDINGKERKLKYLVPGNCHFPFKYRKKDVVSCQIRKDGDWCATKVDENNKMKSWGYCHTKKVIKECPPGKMINPKTGRCINIPENKSKTKKGCPPGKMINPKTGRCINIPKERGILRNNLLSEIKDLSKNVDCSIFNKKESKIKFLGSGVANKVYLSCFNQECKRKVAVRIMSIDNFLPYDNTHPNILELKAYDIFNDLLNKNITQHIPYKIKTFKCGINDLLSSLIGNKMNEYLHYLMTGQIKSNVDILITEYCKFGSAGSFLKKNLKNMNDLDLKVFMFQFMYGLVTLQYHIPHFKHNDIHCENVLVGTYNLKNRTPGNNKYIKYLLFDKEYYLPLREYCVKIYDFDTLSSKQFKNRKLDNIYKQCGITTEDNPVFDYHLGMNSMFSDKRFNSNQPETKQFFNKQIPKRLRGRKNLYLDYNRLTKYPQTLNYNDCNYIPDDVSTPADVLMNDNFFSVFKNKPNNAIIVDTIDSKIPEFSKIKNLKYMFK